MMELTGRFRPFAVIAGLVLEVSHMLRLVEKVQEHVACNDVFRIASISFFKSIVIIQLLSGFE